jgi:hypothetical protein
MRSRAWSEAEALARLAGLVQHRWAASPIRIHSRTPAESVAPSPDQRYRPGDQMYGVVVVTAAKPSRSRIGLLSLDASTSR